MYETRSFICSSSSRSNLDVFLIVGIIVLVFVIRAVFGTGAWSSHGMRCDVMRLLVAAETGTIAGKIWRTSGYV